MDKIKQYLFTSREEFKSELSGLIMESSRLSEQIKESENKKSQLETSIDTSYMILSSSQTANFEQNTEISTLNSIIVDKQNRLSQILERQSYLQNRINDLDDMLLPDNTTDTIDKLEMILKIIEVDPHRAKIEIQNVIDDLIKVSGKGM